MFLTTTNLVHYLLGKGCLTLKQVIDGDCLVVDASRRNRNFKLKTGHNSGLFIKQIREYDQTSISTMQRETACYHMVQSPAFSTLAQIMPRFICADPDRHCLILELFANAQNLNELQRNNQILPDWVGVLLGKSIGTYHQQITGYSFNRDETQHFPGNLPWVFNFHQTSLQSTTPLSGGVQQLAQLIRHQPDLQSALYQLSLCWQYNSLIHGDIKWDNCMLINQAGELPQLKLIDWELVDYGDNCWDVAGVFQSFLSSWIFTMPLHQAMPIAEYLKKAGLPLEKMHSVIKSFWRSYLQSAKLNRQQARHQLLLSIRYCAARLIQTAYEIIYHAVQLSPHAIALLQVSQNILIQPEAAAIELFGFDRELS